MAQTAQIAIANLIEQTMMEKLQPQIEKYAEVSGLKLGSETNIEQKTISAGDVIKTIKAAEEALYGELTGRNYSGERVAALGLNFKETLQTSDASIAFRRIIVNILQEPKEPALFLQNSVAEVMELPEDAPILIEFPSVSALQAFDIDEGQNYPNSEFAFGQGKVSMRIGKMGLTSSFTDEMIRHSMWNLLDMTMRAMANAINRKKEEKLFRTMTTFAKVVFDNQATVSPFDNMSNPNFAANGSDFWTSGKDKDGTTNNATMSYYDIIKMMGVILGDKYNASHFLAHPLAWPILAQDPLMHAAFYHGGQMGQGIWTRNPQYDQQVAMPFNMTYVPYYAIPFVENNTLTGFASGFASCLTTDVYVIDSRNSLYLAQRGAIEMEDYDEWIRDAKVLKARQYAGVAAKDEGRGMVVAKNIRVVRNYEPLFAVRQVTG